MIGRAKSVTILPLVSQEMLQFCHWSTKSASQPKIGENHNLPMDKSAHLFVFKSIDRAVIDVPSFPPQLLNLQRLTVSCLPACLYLEPKTHALLDSDTVVWRRGRAR